MKWLLVMVGLWTCVVGRGALPNLDLLMDDILVLVRKNIPDRIHIPDLYTKWNFKWTLFDVAGQCHCKRGDLRSLKSIKRDDLSEMTATQETTLITSKLKMQKLAFQFRTCYLNAKNWVSVSRKVKVKIDNNSIGVAILLSNDESNCQTAIKSVVFEKFDDFQLETNGGPLADLDVKMYQWLTKYFRDKVKPILEKYLIKSFHYALQKYNLCAKMEEE